MAEQKANMWQRAVDAVLVYLLWAVVILLALWCLVASRSAINIVYIVLTWNRWVLRAVDRWSLLLLGIVWLVGVIVTEAWFRDAAEKGVLWKRFVIVAGSEFVIGGALTMIANLAA